MTVWLMLAVITKAALSALLFWGDECCFQVLIVQPSDHPITNPFSWHVGCQTIVGRMTIDLQKHYEST